MADIPRNVILSLFITGVCTTALWSSLTAPSESTESRTATLVVPQLETDLGDVSQGQILKVPFQVRNAGRRRLVINQHDNCGCLSSVYEATIIPPGQTAELIVPLDARYVSGPVEIVFAYTTSDPTRPNFDLTVRAFVDESHCNDSNEDVRRPASILVRQ